MAAPRICPTCARPVRTSAEARCPLCGGCRTAVGLNEAILDAASTAKSLGEFRDVALGLTRDALGADLGIFATMHSGAVARSTVGFDRTMLARTHEGWSAYGRELAPVDGAAQQIGAATDRRILGVALERT